MVKLADKLAQLESHGYKIRYAIPASAYEFGFVQNWNVTDYAQCDDDRAFIELRDARDDEGYEQCPYWARSNFRSLQRDYPGVFVRIGYGRTESLGMFVHSASSDLIELVCGLTDGAIYDADDWSALEDEERTESFRAWLHSDLYRRLPDWAQDIDADLPDEDIESAFWVEASNSGDVYEVLEASDGEIRVDEERAGEWLIAALRTLKRAELGRSVPSV